MAKYFVKQFAVDGSKTTIPDTGSVSGSVSYQYGFPVPYQLDLLSDPAALPFPRSQFNELLYDTTDAVKQYQENGAPDWISSADNLGTPFAYPIYARVRYDAGGGVLVYENQVAGNTVTPGADSTWFVISGNNGGMPIGAVIPFDGSFPPPGYILRDGSLLNRVAFANLFNAITFLINGTTTNTSTTLSGLVTSRPLAEVIFPNMPIEGAGIPAGTTVVSVSTTTLVMSAAATASATVSVRFFPRGAGDGSTTFQIGDSRRRSFIGSGGTGTAVVGNINGQTGGVEDKSILIPNLPSHGHPGSTVGTGASAGILGCLEANSSTAGSQPINVALEGGNVPLPIYHPVDVCTMCVRAQ